MPVPQLRTGDQVADQRIALLVAQAVLELDRKLLPGAFVVLRLGGGANRLSMSIGDHRVAPLARLRRRDAETFEQAHRSTQPDEQTDPVVLRKACLQQTEVGSIGR